LKQVRASRFPTMFTLIMMNNINNKSDVSVK